MPTVLWSLPFFHDVFPPCTSGPGSFGRPLRRREFGPQEVVQGDNAQ